MIYFNLTSSSIRPRWVLFLALFCTGVVAAYGQDTSTSAQVKNSEEAKHTERKTLWDQAEQLAAEGKVAEAVTAGERVLSLERELFGQTHEDLTDTLQWLSYSYLEQQDLGKAEQHAAELLRVQEALLRNDGQQTTDARWFLDYVTKLARAEPAKRTVILAIAAEYSQLYAARRLAEAAAQIEKLIPLEEALLGSEHPFLANKFSNLASCLLEAGQFAEAESAAEHALIIRRKQLGERHSDTANSEFLLARTQIKQNKLEEALEHLDLARDTWHARGQLPEAAWMDSWRADGLFAIGRHVEAKVAYLASLHAFETIQLEAGIASLQERTAVFAVRVGDWQLAEEMRVKQLESRIKRYGHSDYRVTDARLAVEHMRLLSSLTEEERKRLHQAERWSSQVVQLYSTGEYVQAIPLAERVRDIRKELLGENHPGYVMNLKNLASNYLMSGEYSKAESLMVQASDLYRDVLGARHPDYATSLNDLAGLYASKKDYAKAEPLYRHARDIRKEVLGERHLDYITSLNNLAFVHFSMSDYSKAEPLYLQVRDIRKEVLGERHPKYAISLDNLAQLYYSMGDYAKAEPFFVRVLEIKKENLGERHLSYATSLIKLAQLYSSMEDYTQAEPLLVQAQSLHKEVFGERHPQYAIILSDLALLYASTMDYVKAEPLYAQARDLAKELQGERHPDYATILSSMALLYSKMGNYAKAQPLLVQALEISKEALGERHPDYATRLNNLASLYKSMGDYSKAKLLFHEALAILEKVPGKAFPIYAASLNNLADLYKSMGDYAKAEPLFLQALEIIKEVLGERHSNYATSLINLAGLYSSMGDYTQAERLLVQARVIFMEVGERHPHYSQGVNNLAVLYWSVGDYAKAEPLFLQVLEIRKEVQGEGHPDYATSLFNLAKLYHALGDYAKADPLYRQSLAISRTVLENSALVQSERQQLAMSQMLLYQLDGFVSLTLEANQFQTSAAREVLRWKGATLVRQRAMRLAADDPTVADRFGELQALTRRLASLSRSAPAEGLDDWRERVLTLTAQKEKLEAQLSRDSAAFRRASQDVTLEQIQAALPADAVLVDYLQFTRSRPAEQKGKWTSESSLLATVVPRIGEPVLVDLGPIAQVSEAIDTWRLTFGMSPQGQAAGRLLRERLWNPVLAAVEALAQDGLPAEKSAGVDRLLLVSTDGVLGRMPLIALPGKEPGGHLLEDHRLAMIPVPQLLPALMNDVGPKALSRELLLLGDVDYEAEPQAAPAAKRKPRSRAVGAGDEGNFQPLEGTRGEIASIAKLYGDLFETTADDIETLERAAASESRFRELSPQFFHLHLATHGFFAPAKSPSALSSKALLAVPDRAAVSRGLLSTDDVQVTGYNPDLLSGLAFAGANRPPQEDSDDGILTAQEIAFLPLEGVETIVLSACETGLGEVAGGEGLLGVQRAFQISGARTTVASLWKVDDVVTRRLMERFYDNLWRKEMPRLESLREAQLHILNNPESIRGATLEQAPVTQRVPPYYWAAFLLAGDWR